MRSLSEKCAGAVRDYRWLLDRGYTGEVPRTMVADHYQLDRGERTLLYRGVSSASESALRRARLVELPAAEAGLLTIDAPNVLITVCAYLLGLPVFLSTDGFLRDGAELHGGRVASSVLRAAASDVIAGLSTMGCTLDATWCIDSRIDIALLLVETVVAAGVLPERTVLVPSADAVLAGAQSGAIATSDSAVIARSRLPVVDLARLSIEAAHSPCFVDLAEFV